MTKYVALGFVKGSKRMISRNSIEDVQFKFVKNWEVDPIGIFTVSEMMNAELRIVDAVKKLKHQRRI